MHGQGNSAGGNKRNRQRKRWEDNIKNRTVLKCGESLQEQMKAEVDVLLKRRLWFPSTVNVNAAITLKNTVGRYNFCIFIGR